MSRSFFITAAGTGIGKTLVTTALAWQLRRAGKTVAALKPVISGYDASDGQGDTGLILRSSGVADIEAVSPWRFAAAISPDMAAARENARIDVEAVATFCRRERAVDVVLAEGVGGVMTPLGEAHTVLDWMERLGWPVILVGGSYLGALSHTLAAAECVLARGLALRAVIVSASESMPVPLEETAAALKRFLPGAVPVVQLPRLAAKDDLWQHAPPLSWICDER